jgi:hypothetical protein
LGNSAISGSEADFTFSELVVHEGFERAPIGIPNFLNFETCVSAGSSNFAVSHLLEFHLIDDSLADFAGIFARRSVGSSRSFKDCGVSDGDGA